MPLLSIIVPTKNRYAYLKECIKSLVNIELDNVEIVIQDNSDNNSEILSYMQEYSSPIIKYFYTDDKIGMSENASRAIENSSGKYLIFIGDDDTVCSDICRLVRIMEEEQLDSCVFTLAKYYWPDNKYCDQNLPNLQYSATTGRVHMIDPINELKKVVGSSYNGLCDMPKIYHGLVTRSAMEEVKRISGSYFPGPSPDMANAVALSLVVKRHAYVDLMVFVSGYGGNSGGNRFRGIKIDDKGKIPWLPADIAETWFEGLPRIYTNQVIWAQSAFEALKRMDALEEYKKYINYHKIYAQYLSYIPRITDIVKLHPGFVVTVKTLCWWLVFMVRRMKNLFLRKVIRRMPSNVLCKYKVLSLCDAQQLIEEYNRNMVK